MRINLPHFVQFEQYYEILHCCSEFFLTEVPVISQAFLRSVSTQYRGAYRHTLSPGFPTRRMVGGGQPLVDYLKFWTQKLANVNSRSHIIVRPSVVCRLSVCL